MTITEAKKVVYSSLYRVVRNATPPSIAEFYDMTIDETVPDTNGPSGWEDFWWESIVVEIQAAIMTRKEYVTNFDFAWLKANKSKKWSFVITYIGSQIGPLT